MSSESWRATIAADVWQYHADTFKARPFVPGETPVPCSGKVFDADEIQAGVDAMLDFHLTEGRFCKEFSRLLSQQFGLRHACLCNSGSSANLLAVSALTSPSLGDARLRPGDEVITVAAGFPTTVNPIVQNGLVPVFVDISLPTYNVDVTQLEAAISPRTRAVMLAHTLGNPFDGRVNAFCEQHGLYCIHDCCDALGTSVFDGFLESQWQVGFNADIATCSFYPAHHITVGEGGCVLTNRPKLSVAINSFCSWGKRCVCPPAVDNTCGKRFGWQLGDLPFGFDDKYIFSHIGYNLKMTDMQAAIGVAQMKKLPDFIAARRRNFQFLRDNLRDMEDRFILPEPTQGSEPAWFGFPITVRKDAGFGRKELVAYLEGRQIATRPIFAGNLTRQPAWKGVNYRKVGELTVTDQVMHDAFWIGVWPGLTQEMLAYMVESIKEFCKR